MEHHNTCAGRASIYGNIVQEIARSSMTNYQVKFCVYMDNCDEFWDLFVGSVKSATPKGSTRTPLAQVNTFSLFKPALRAKGYWLGVSGYHDNSTHPYGPHSPTCRAMLSGR